MVDMPHRCFLDWQIGESNRPLSPNMPFDFFGIVLKDNYVEMMEGDYFDELVSENS